MANFVEIPLPVENFLDIIVEDGVDEKVSSRGKKKKNDVENPSAENTGANT